MIFHDRLGSLAGAVPLVHVHAPVTVGVETLHELRGVLLPLREDLGAPLGALVLVRDVAPRLEVTQRVDRLTGAHDAFGVSVPTAEHASEP